MSKKVLWSMFLGINFLVTQVGVPALQGISPDSASSQDYSKDSNGSYEHVKQMVKNVAHTASSNLLWTQGKEIMLALGVVGGISAVYFRPLALVSGLLGAFSFWFFRNPDRHCSEYDTDKSVIICPSEGKVVDISPLTDEPEAAQGYAYRISIFLSPLDIHVMWTPVQGIIDQVAYYSGKFMFAFLPKSSLLNEHNDIVIKMADGTRVKVRQIAGFVARRICCWVKEGDALNAGHKYGMIKFGSRVDVFLPKNVEIAVGLNQRVKGGETVLGRWKHGINAKNS